MVFSVQNQILIKLLDYCFVVLRPNLKKMIRISLIVFFLFSSINNVLNAQYEEYSLTSQFSSHVDHLKIDNRVFFENKNQSVFVLNDENIEFVIDSTEVDSVEIDTALSNDSINQLVLDSLEVDSIRDFRIAEQDTLEKKRRFLNPLQSVDFSNLPYFFDDLMIVGGLNLSSLNFSNHFRQISLDRGWQLGIEGYYPIHDKIFLLGGIQYANTAFKHAEYDVGIRFHHIAVPLFLAYELPASRDYDWRIFIGSQFSVIPAVTQTGEYNVDIPTFRYDPEYANNYDFGFTFGLSWERYDFYLRLRGYFGVVKSFTNLHPVTGVGETAMMQTFSIEFGYLLFRSMRKF